MMTRNMKKIGILTYHRSINYGAFLQCYSLSHFIQKRYGEKVKVEIIDFETREEFFVRIKFLLKSKNILHFIQKIKMYIDFTKDQKQYLPYGSLRIISNSPRALEKKIKNKYDIIIVGSDAVWNSVSKEGKFNYFLPGVKCKFKMSYAASTNGLDTKSINKNQSTFLNKCLDDFYYIGVREEKGVEFVKNINYKFHAHRNCDPTCFIDLSDFDDTIIQKFNKYGINKDKPIICLMTPNEHIGKIVYERFHTCYQIISIYTYNKYSDFTLLDLRPTEFAVFFKYVKLLFSFFFHGSYMCLNNGTPVIAVDEDNEPDKKVTKIEYLFNNLGLEDWYFRTKEISEDCDRRLLNTACSILSMKDYRDEIFSKLSEERKNMGTFIKQLDEVIDFKS